MLMVTYYLCIYFAVLTVGFKNESDAIKDVTNKLPQFKTTFSTETPTWPWSTTKSTTWSPPWSTIKTTTKKPTTKPPFTTTSQRPSWTTTNGPDCVVADSSDQTYNYILGVGALLLLGVVTLIGIQCYTIYQKKQPSSRTGSIENGKSFRRRPRAAEVVQSARYSGLPTTVASREEQMYDPVYGQPIVKGGVYTAESTTSGGFDLAGIGPGTEVPIRKPRSGPVKVKIIPGSPGVTGINVVPSPPRSPVQNVKDPRAWSSNME